MRNLIHKITIREWAYFSRSSDIASLKKYKVNMGNVNELIALVDAEIGEFNDFDKERNKLNSRYKIQELITYYRNLNHLMIHQLKVELWILELGLKGNESEKINEAIKTKSEQVKTKYGIEINTVEDLVKIENEINRRLDKFAEMNKVIETGPGITFSQLVINVFKILGYDRIEYDMVLSDFFDLKKEAIKATRKWQN